MAGGGNFIHRVISYVANELIVNGLANSCGLHGPCRSRLAGDRRRGIQGRSGIRVAAFHGSYLAGLAVSSPSFQRFAVRTSRKMEDLSKMAEQTKRELADQIKDASKNFESFKNQ